MILCPLELPDKGDLPEAAACDLLSCLRLSAAGTLEHSGLLFGGRSNPVQWLWSWSMTESKLNGDRANEAGCEKNEVWPQ